MDTIFNKTDLNDHHVWQKGAGGLKIWLNVYSEFILIYFGTCGDSRNSEWGGLPSLAHAAGLLKHAAVFFLLFHPGVANVRVQRVLQRKKESTPLCEEKKKLQIPLGWLWAVLVLKFPQDDVRSAARWTVSGNGFWSSQDIITIPASPHAIFNSVLS